MPGLLLVHPYTLNHSRCDTGNSRSKRFLYLPKGMGILTHCNNNSGLGWGGIAKDLKKILIIGNIYCLHSDCYNEESN